MPCSDWDQSQNHYAQEITQLRRRLDLTTRLACEYLTSLEAEGKPIPTYATQWWERHKEKDNARRRQEKEERKAKKIKRDARKKLKATMSEEELEALGIDI